MIRTLFISGLLLTAGCITLLINGITMMKNIDEVNAAKQARVHIAATGAPVNEDADMITMVPIDVNTVDAGHRPARKKSRAHNIKPLSHNESLRAKKLPVR